MKKWLLPFAAVLVLTACSDDKAEDAPTDKSTEQLEEPKTVTGVNGELTISPVETPNEDVQVVLDMTEDSTFASFIYSLSGDSYLILNATGTVDVTLDDTENTLNIRVKHDEDDTPEKIEQHVYAVAFEQEYETIKVFENDEEISFDIWTE